MTYKVIKGNSLKYVESELNYRSEQYDDFTVHGGINNYGGYFTVLVSYSDKLSKAAIAVYKRCLTP